MEENTNLNEQLTADQSDAFLDGWNDTEDIPTADQPEETEVSDADAEETAETTADDGNSEESVSESETEGDAETTDGASGNEEADAEKTGKQETADASWVIKHLGGEKTMTAKDVTPELLQKGLDYDRIRGKYDEAKPVMEMFTEFAKNAGMSVADYARHIRAEAKKASGMSEAEAKRAVELEDREAAVAAKEAQQQESADEKTRSAEKISAEVEEFSRAFPEVYKQAENDPKALPKSVYESWKSGLTLTAAYAKYVVAQAAAEKKASEKREETAAQNAKNAARSTGSMKSAGNDTKSKDAFLEGFDA